MSTLPVNTFGATFDQRSEPSVLRFLDALDVAAAKLRVCVPGIIQSFDATKQTVTVLPALTEEIRVKGQLTIMPLPLLVDVPIQLPRAGKFSLTMPIQQGDECLVLFADMCIDSWYQSGDVQNQLEKRRHDLSDGFAIVGCWSQPNVLENYSTDTAQLRNEDGTVVIDVADDQITVTAPTVTVNASDTATVNAATAKVIASGTATVQGDTVDVTGSTTVTISGNSTTHIDGKNWLLHEHSGVSTGGGISGPVV